jgi:hypothetical protein
MIVIENINLIKEYNCPYTMCGQLVYNVVNYQNDWSGEVTQEKGLYFIGKNMDNEQFIYKEVF